MLPFQKSTGFDLSIFYPLRKQWYIISPLGLDIIKGGVPPLYLISRRMYCAFAMMIYTATPSLICTKSVFCLKILEKLTIL